MNRLLLLLPLLLVSGALIAAPKAPAPAPADAPAATLGGAASPLGSFGDVPVDINAETMNYEGSLAVARGDVLIRYGPVVIYCDYAQYNPDTRDILALGNVRIFREQRVFTGERAIYNLETKQLTAADFHGSSYPYIFSADTFSSLGPNAYQARNVTFTTDDESKPSYTLRAHGARIYPNDRVIMRDVFLYLGQTPVFWFPYVYQSLNKEQGFLLAPGYTSTLGAYLFTRYTFPLTEDISATLRVDLMSSRGLGLGFDAKWEGSDKKEEWGRFSAYYLYDLKPGLNNTDTRREPIDPNRYRISFQDRTYLTEDIYATIDINKLSDARFLQDFEPGDFKRNPNPDNVLALTKFDDDFTLTFIARKQLNDIFDFTERLPELDLDIKRQPVFGQSGFFYDGETGAGFLRRNFAVDSIFPDYDATRFDSYHQLSYPQNLGWLSVVPHAGIRGTYYSNSGTFIDRLERIPGDDSSDRVVTPQLHPGAELFRGVFDGGVESSFKLTRRWEGVQSRAWGLDGFAHVLQPYLNASFVYTTVNPSEILQFDRVNPSTRLPPIEFPQFTSIDSIENQAIVQLGARNRFETRRDNLTFTWLEWNSFFNINLHRPEFENTFLDTSQEIARNGDFDRNASLRNKVADPGTFSNLYNTFRWTPLPWMALGIDAQTPVFDKGFWEVNTSINLLATENLNLFASHRYLSGNVYFEDSNQVTVGAVYRVNDNWSASVRETFEFEVGRLESERYEIHRDLSSWIATFGFVVDNNGGGKSDYGLELVFTLKDLPLARIPLNLDPSEVTGLSGGR